MLVFNSKLSVFCAVIICLLQVGCGDSQNQGTEREITQQESEPTPELNSETSSNPELELIDLTVDSCLAALPQGPTYILGDKWLLNDEVDQNGLTSPAYIELIGEFETEQAAEEELRRLKKRKPNAFNTAKILNTSNYYYSNKQLNFAIYKVGDNNKTIRKIRPNNFSYDSNLTFEELPSAYCNYKVSKIMATNIVVIQQKRTYELGRPFVRFIYFDDRNRQARAITINDYELIAQEKLANDNLFLSFNTPDYGAKFNPKIAATRIVIMDSTLQLINDVSFELPIARLTSIRTTENSIILKLKRFYGCHICFEEVAHYEMIFDYSLQFVTINVIKQPNGIKINEEQLKSELKFKSNLQKN